MRRHADKHGAATAHPGKRRQALRQRLDGIGTLANVISLIRTHPDRAASLLRR